MKKFLIFLLVLLILIGIPGGFLFYVVSDPLKVDEQIKVQIQEGDSFYNVLANLDNENKLKFTPVIKVYLKILHPNIEVLPGIYNINGNMSLEEILSAVTDKNGTSEVDITIPEGFTIEEIAKELETNDICTNAEFINAVKNYPAPSYINTNPEEVINYQTGKPCKDQGLRYSLEGYLYPDTYKFRKGTSPENIIETMLNKFEEVIAQVEKQTDVTLDREGGQLSRVITRASMIERECKLDNERAIISSVMFNRVDEGMPFQMDATTIYAIGTHKEVVTLDDVYGTDSAYNTYVIYGLPVGPIANPGIKSIIAAIEPAETDYLYYVLNPETQADHYFTNNGKDFNAKLVEWGY